MDFKFIRFYLILCLITVVLSEDVDNLTIEEKIDLLFQTYQDGLQNTIDRYTELALSIDTDLVRHAHSDCVWEICTKNASMEEIQQKCTEIYGKITKNPNPHLIQRLIYDLGELFPLLTSVNITREDFADTFINVLNTRSYEYCSDTWNLRQNYFWQALRPGSYGSSFLKTNPTRGMNMSKDERRVIISTFTKLIDNVPLRTINSLLSVGKLQIALDFNNSAISRASKLKESPYADWPKTLSFLRLASAFKPNLPIFLKYTDDFPQTVFNCIRLGKEEAYLETPANSGFRENLILSRYLSIVPEDTRYEILTKMMKDIKNGLPIGQEIVEEVGKLLEPYKKQLPDGYKVLLDRLVLDKNFKEAHERLQRKILWETILPSTRNGFDVDLNEKEVEDTVLTALIEEIQKIRIVAEIDRNMERETGHIMAQILYNPSKEEAEKIKEKENFLQQHQKNPFISGEFYQYNASLDKILVEAKLNPVETMRKVYSLAQNRDFRDFGNEMKKKILKKVLDPEAKLELLDGIVEQEVYGLVNA